MTNPIFRNQFPAGLATELAAAQRLGIMPMRMGDPRFAEIANGGTIKWAVTENNELFVIPKNVAKLELSHTILTNGDPVLAAGEADITFVEGTFFGIEINNHSGHYQLSIESLAIGRAAFLRHGIIFA